MLQPVPAQSAPAAPASYRQALAEKSRQSRKRNCFACCQRMVGRHQRTNGLLGYRRYRHVFFWRRVMRQNEIGLIRSQVGDEVIGRPDVDMKPDIRMIHLKAGYC